MKLFPPHRQIVEQYVQGLRLDEGGIDIVNDAFTPFREMVLSLPDCRDLAPWDVVSIAVDIALKFSKRDARAGGGSPDADQGALAADYLIGFLESLPREYKVRYELPQVPSWGNFSIALARNVALTSRKPADGDATRNALAQALVSAQGRAPDSGVSIEIDLRGFASSSLESPVVSDSLSLLKQTVFLLKHARLVTSLPWTETLARAWVTDVADRRETALQLPEHLARALGSLRPDTDALRVWDTNKGGGLFGSQRKPETDAEWAAAFQGNTVQVSNYFANCHRTGFSRVAAAIEWYEDSRLNDDQSLAFLAACIGLESIFGEEGSGMNELSRRLADRYSFMLGKDRDERVKLASEFDEVLKVRGQLVHARTSRLKAKDRLQLDRVRDMLWRSIQHEIRPFLVQPTPGEA